jgi:hypothetical protein
MKRLVHFIQHPDELQEELSALSIEWGSGKQSDYRQGVVEGLRLASLAVQSHTFGQWVES